MLKKIIYILFFSLLSVYSCFGQVECIEKTIDKKAIHPRYREWASPKDGKVVQVNPTPLLWPAAKGKDVTYQVRLSQNKNFEGDNTIVSDTIPWAMYSSHHKLEHGKWYWQYATIRENNIEWSETYDFIIEEGTRVFETPTIEEFISFCTTSHPHLYVQKNDLSEFQIRNKNNVEAKNIIRKARKQLIAPLPEELPTRPRDTVGLSDSQKKVMMNFMYHRFGDKVKEPVKDLSMAYLLTGEKEYAQTALKQALHISKMDPKGYATREDFNAASVMLAMSVAFDTAYDLATPKERNQLLQAIKVRGEYFFNSYVNEFETHSMDNHVWQHTLRRLCFSAIATINDLPEARKWLAYCYEVWCCRFPILGGDDGGWHDGSSYFQVNFETFIYIPFIFKQLTGVDFFDIPYYKNLSKFLIYSYPKNSYSTGFGDNAENQNKPGKSYWGFADALARELHDPYARWYADQISEGQKEIVTESANFAFYRLLTKNNVEDTQPRSPEDLPQSLLFKDAGFALMHNDVANTPQDIMVTFMGLPFGSTGHAHAAHNGFSVNVGGKQMFGGSGHYSNFTDKHTLMHYRTRGHNTILADSMAQVIGENGYGWIARFKDTSSFTYALGDATHAYDTMSTPFWINRMQQFDVAYTKENGFGNPGVTRFRRHFVFLRPNIIVIYDELKAKEPITWTWLLHSYNKMQAGEKSGVIFGKNEVATSRVDIFNQQPLTSHITDQFFSPAINWKGRGSSNNGEPYAYENHWHSESTTQTKSDASRFLTVIQIDWKTDSSNLLAPRAKGKNKWEIPGWTIEAEMDGQKTPKLVIKSKAGDVIEYINQGCTTIKQGGKIVDILEDEIPDTAK